MAFTILGYILFALGFFYMLQAIFFVWTNKSGKLKSVLLMANFVIWGRLFITLHQSPQTANNTISLIFIWAVVNVIVLTIITIVRRKKRI